MINTTHSLTTDKLSAQVITLDNQMKVILKEDNKTPMTAIHLRILTGSIDEEDYWGGGLSHFFEHSLFLGSQKYPKPESYSSAIEKMGGSDVNAYTSFDHTAYHFTVLSKYTLQGLEAIENLVFHPLFPQEAVKNEMGSIISEMDMINDDPDHYFQEVMQSFLYQNTPYKYPIIGLKERFNRLSTEELLSYYYKRYVPNNMILSIVGDFDQNKIIPEIKSLFEKHQAKKIKQFNFAAELPYRDEVFQLTHPKANHSRCAISWQGACINQKDVFALDVLASILAGDKGSIFYETMKEEKAIVEYVKAYSWNNVHNGLFQIEYDLLSFNDLKDIQKNIQTILKLQDTLIEDLFNRSDQSLEEILESTKNEVLYYIANKNKTLSQNASFLANALMYHNDLNYDKTYCDGILRVTPNDVRLVIKNYLKKPKKIAFLLPKDSILTQNKIPIMPNAIMVNGLSQNLDDPKYQEYFVTTASLMKIASDEKGIYFKKATQSDSGINEKNIFDQAPVKKIFSNGFTLLNYSCSDRPIVECVVRFIGGLQAEQSYINGSFQLLSSLLLTSNVKYTKKDINKLLKDNAIVCTSDSGYYTFGLHFSCLKEKLPIVINILSAILETQTFNVNDFDLIKKDSLFDIKNLEEDGWYISGKYFRSHFYKGSVFQNPLEGTVESLEKIDLKSLESIKKLFMVPQNMVMSLYGDLSENESIEYIEKLFSNELKSINLDSKAVFEQNNVTFFNTDAIKKTRFTRSDYKGHNDILYNVMRSNKQTFIRMAFALPRLETQEDQLRQIATVKILNACFGGMGGVLFALRSKPFMDEQGRNLGGKAYSIGSFYDDTFHTNAIVFYTALRYEARNHEKEMIDDLLSSIHLLKQVFDENFFTRAKNLCIGALLNQSRLLNNRAVYEASDELLGKYFDVYHAYYRKEIQQVMSQVTMQEVKDSIGLLTKEKMMVHVLHP